MLERLGRSDEARSAYENAVTHLQEMVAKAPKYQQRLSQRRQNLDRFLATHN